MNRAPRLRIVWHWFTMGPYHFARMRALQQLNVELTVVETTAVDDHNWVRDPLPADLDVVTLTRDPKDDSVHRATGPSYAAVLEQRSPHIVVESGYANPHARRVAFQYRQAHPDTLTLIWSETTAFDHARHWWRERFKAYLLSEVDGALVAGTPHARYLESLGMPLECIGIAGGCVDNEFFASRAARARSTPGLRGALQLPERYFVYVGRFTEAKNLFILIKAFGRYRRLAGAGAWDLVLVGDGPDAKSLRGLVADEAISGVHFTGIRQATELPAYYGLGDAFILPSISEPWGLVANEAMASGLPALISDRCGCAEDLITDGQTGFLFDPTNTQQLAELMLKVSTARALTAEVAARGNQRVKAFNKARYAAQTLARCEALYQDIASGGYRRPRRPPLLTLVLGRAIDAGEQLLIPS